MSADARREGFTLVELSIVLVIIGLLIGGILVAQSMMSTVRVQRVVRDLQQYNSAFNLFKATYTYWPGDSPNAYNMLGATCTASPGATAPNQINGNGDGIISKSGSTFEGSLAFCEAKALGFIDQSVAFTAPYKNSSYQVENSNSRCDMGVSDSCFVLTASESWCGDERCDTVTPSDAAAIDAKMDDGKIDSGIVTGQEAPFGPNANQCGHWIGKYNITYTSPACWITFKIRDGGTY